MILKYRLILANSIFFLILVSSALRSDSVNNADAIPIQYPVWVSLIQSSSILILILSLFISILFLIFERKRSLNISLSLIFLVFFNFYYISVQYYYFGYSNRLLFALLLTLIYFLFFSSFIPTFFSSNLSKILDCVLSSSLFLVFLNFMLYIIDSSSVTWQGRFYGLHTHPNFLAVICSVAIVLSINKLLRIQWSNIKLIVFYIFLVLISFFIIVLTGSRTGILSVLFGIFLTIFIYFKKYPKKISIFLVTIGVILFLAILNLLSLDSENFRYNRFISNDDTRSELWQHMWTVFLDNPLFGAGNGMGTANSYLRVLSDTGLIGFILFFFALLPFFILFFKYIINKNIFYDSTKIMYFPFAFTIFIGAVTEGYLLDFNSFPLLCLYLILSTLGIRVKKLKN
jgi:O-antigen ligase